MPKTTNIASNLVHREDYFIEAPDTSLQPLSHNTNEPCFCPFQRSPHLSRKFHLISVWIDLWLAGRRRSSMAKGRLPLISWVLIVLCEGILLAAAQSQQETGQDTFNTQISPESFVSPQPAGETFLGDAPGLVTGPSLAADNVSNTTVVSASAATESTASATESTAGATESTAGATEGTAAAPDGTAAATDGTAAAPEGAAAATDGTATTTEGAAAATAGSVTSTAVDMVGGTPRSRRHKNSRRQRVTSLGDSGAILEVTSAAAVTVAAITWNGDVATGCDFPGQDLTSVSGIAAAQCRPRCASNSTCTHFVWSKFKQGTCFLKKGPRTKAAAISTTDSTMVCGLLVNWNGNDWANACDFKNRDLKQAKVANYQCGPTCVNTKNCTHYTWTTFNGGTCFMKQGVVNKLDAFTTTDNSMVCGVVVNWNGNDWANACDFKNRDLQQAKVANHQCGPTCVNTQGCTHYTWTTFNGGTCFMKQGVVNKLDAFTTTDNSMVCGVVVNWNGNDWANACDFKNRDLQQAKVPNSQCGPTCANTKGCTHYTWTTLNGGTCFMKQGVVNKLDAFSTTDNSMVCGIVSNVIPPPPGQRQISFTNTCPNTIWIASTPNNNANPLPNPLVQLTPGQTFTYQMPAAQWAGRFWPKVGCDNTGRNCTFGDSIAPCPSGGCQPPAETKVEFFYPASGQSGDAWYDISLVDGYSLPMRIVPSVQQGSCITTTCSLSLNACPANEAGYGDLRVVRGGQTVACLSPCMKWTYPAPYGGGRGVKEEPGVWMCCPTPPISPQQCSAGPVVKTQFVQLVRKSCPTAYSYAYDDEAGLHNCPGSTSFAVTVCP